MQGRLPLQRRTSDDRPVLRHDRAAPRPAQSAPLIAGAGPTGLAAALFLARQGLFARIVDPRPEPSHRSKALAVNPRTLDLLEPTGATARMLALGMPLHGLTLHDDAGVLRTVSFARVHPRYPFMLALSQAATESLLEEAAGSTCSRTSPRASPPSSPRCVACCHSRSPWRRCGAA